MGILEKIVHSNTFEVNIYKEGVFWIAYEQSAYYFGMKKGYKPAKKFIKSLGQEVISIGFPEKSISTFGDLIAERDEPGRKTFILPEPINNQDFQAWKAATPLQEAKIPENKGEKTVSPEENEIVRRLFAFPLAGKTPIECMTFLAELQKYGHLR